jgi:hypothetical protein
MVILNTMEDSRIDPDTEGCIKLWVEVLLTARQDLASAEDADQAEYFLSNRYGWYEWICDLVGLDMAFTERVLRDGVVPGDPKKPRKIYGPCNYKPRECEVCGETYLPKIKRQRVCSKGCGTIRKREYMRRYKENKNGQS